MKRAKGKKDPFTEHWLRLTGHGSVKAVTGGDGSKLPAGQCLVVVQDLPEVLFEEIAIKELVKRWMKTKPGDVIVAFMDAGDLDEMASFGQAVH
jgi:hypothetical protein